MQDRFSIGPVTIVQLVGLTAKPRIASAQADGAARAADATPPSAAAGLGDNLTQPLANSEPSYLNLKPAPALSLTADPVGSHISLEAGVDRPVVDANALTPPIGPSASDNFLPGNNPVNPSTQVRGEVPSADAPQDAAPLGVEASMVDSAVTGHTFDGVDGFGDDKIIDFDVHPVAAPTIHDSSAESFLIGTEADSMLMVLITDEQGSFGSISLSVDVTSDIPITKSDLTAFDPHPSTTDAIPVI